MPELEFDPAYPVRVTSQSQDNHPTVVETTRGLLAVVYERGGEMWRSYSLDRGLTWSQPGQLSLQVPIYTPSSAFNDRNGFALVWGNPDLTADVWFAEINEISYISEHLMGVRIQRAIGTTSKGAEVSLVNPRNMYDPEVEGTEWTGVMLPGAKMTIDLGYGGENKNRFTGFIDDVTLEDRTGQIRITGRGDMKQLLDQSLRTRRIYTNEKRTKNIADLAVEAGIDADKIFIEDHPAVFSENFERERTYSDVIQGHINALGYELIEPDEGGLIARVPVLDASPQWFYEEELNMYTRERAWDDDEVVSGVVAYREAEFAEDGTTMTVSALEWESLVPTPFHVPPRKMAYVKIGPTATVQDAQDIAWGAAWYYGRQGREVQIVGPLNVVLEVGDVINIRRKSWNQSGIYIVEALDDDCKRNLGQSRELAGTSRGGQYASGQGGGGGFANIIRARKLTLDL